jgi:iron(III) transport system ATP-binding protein
MNMAHNDYRGDRPVPSSAPPAGAAESEPAGDPGGPDGRTVLVLEGIEKAFGSAVAVEGLSARIGEGEVLSLLGPSGCGKTTTLRTVGGLERPDAGTVELDGRTVADAGTDVFVPPEERNVGLVFQDFALFPHLSAAENVGFGIADRPDDERETRVEELLELVGLASHAEHYPDELSGGQKQRIALARSLAPEPDVLLLDEPLSNLDIGLRVSMREEIKAILDEAGVTAIWVTHDQEEALSVADRVGIMRDGHLHQIGRPEDVFERPDSRFVASFLGQAGFLSARPDGGHLETAIGEIDADRCGDPDAARGTTIDVLVRPDDLRAVPVTGDESAHGRITRRQYHGPSFVYRVETSGGDVVHCLHNHTDVFEVGQPVRVDLVADHPLPWYRTDSAAPSANGRRTDRS